MSTSLRLGLATVNREANDNHIEVAQLIMENRALPTSNQCVECFQPKLYHYSMATIFDLLDIDLDDSGSQIVLAQWLNALAGAVVVLVAWVFLNALPIENEHLKFAAFLLVAFNPKLIGINAQATNDTLAILLSTLAVYSAWRFLERERAWQLIACILLVSLGVATKTSVWATAAAILIALLVKAWTKRRKALVVPAILLMVGVVMLSLLNPLTQYVQNYKRVGSIAVMNKERDPFPAFAEASYFRRPGIVSIRDGLLTFKYLDLLAYPRLTHSSDDYPQHRTSLWTQLFARAHSVHFDNYPESWSSQGTDTFALTRAIYVFALLPTLLILVGAGISLFRLCRVIARKDSALHGTGFGLFDALFWGYAAAIVLFALRYRDFATMKAIFIYPALLSFVFLYSAAVQTLERWPKGRRWSTGVVLSVSGVLAILYIGDVCALGAQLYGQL